MSLKDTITEDMKTAMKAKDTARLGTIRLLQAAMKQKEVDERVTLDDVQIVAIIDKLIKQRKDSISAYEQAKREDLAQIERDEMAVLEVYLPQRMSQEEVQVAVKALVAQLGATGPADMGRVMAAAKTEFTGKAEMSHVSMAVKAALNP
jgi:hypothetical protein